MHLTCLSLSSSFFRKETLINAILIKYNAFRRFTSVIVNGFMQDIVHVSNLTDQPDNELPSTSGEQMMAANKVSPGDMKNLNF